MSKIIVDRVEPYGSDSECASVTLKSPFGELVVFCHPCTLKKGDLVENHLSALDSDARAAYLPDWPEDLKKEKSKERLEKTGPYSYRGCGRVLDKRSGLIEVLGFRIELDQVPCEGVVEFECMRVDI